MLYLHEGLHYNCVNESKASCDDAVIWNCPQCRKVNENILQTTARLGLLGNEMNKLKDEVMHDFSAILESSTYTDG